MTSKLALILLALLPACSPAPIPMGDPRASAQDRADCDPAEARREAQPLLNEAGGRIVPDRGKLYVDPPKWYALPAGTKLRLIALTDCVMSGPGYDLNWDFVGQAPWPSWWWTDPASLVQISGPELLKLRRQGLARTVARPPAFNPFGAFVRRERPKEYVVSSDVAANFVSDAVGDAAPNP